MQQNPDSRVSAETRRLLAELDQAIDHSSAIRDIVRRREQLHDLERLTGPSPQTRELRRQIRLLEQRLRADRADAGLVPPAPVLPA